MLINFEIEGMRELVDSIERMGKVPQKCVTAAARQGANVALRAARMLAPKDSGALKKGLTVKKERSRTKGKAVFDVVPSAKKNSIFVKESGAKRYYYPASMEFGFRGKKSGEKVYQGRHYLLKGLTNNAAEVERVVIKVLTERIDQEWAKGGG